MGQNETEFDTSALEDPLINHPITTFWVVAHFPDFSICLKTMHR